MKREELEILAKHEDKIIDLYVRLGDLENQVDRMMTFETRKLEIAMEEVCGKLDALAEFEYVEAHWQITDRPAWQKGDYWELRQKDDTNA